MTDSPNPSAAAEALTLAVPDFALVVLIGATGSGKSSFARRQFAETEVVSSDRARALIVDDETDLSIHADAFELVGAIVAKRLKHRRFTVVDATNVRSADRRQWIELARAWHALPVAIVLDVDLDTCVARNRTRPDRAFGPQVPQRMIQDIRKSLSGLQREGFRQVWHLNSVAAIDAAQVVRQPLWVDRRDLAGPFDIIGDVHGCYQELVSLLSTLGYRVEPGQAGPVVVPPPGRRAVFVGDLVDRGPDSPAVLRLVMAMVAAGTGLCVVGNHDDKFLRWLKGRPVKTTHGLAETIQQMEGVETGFRREVAAFIDDLRSHLWLDGGRLCVAHAGLTEAMIGRASGAVRAFALYGETTGEIDAYGLPVRADWAAAYRGGAAVVYGHTPTLTPEWVNNTLCIDTGCVFGGALSALRWPEREVVSVPAAKVYAEPVRPLAEAPSDRSAQAIADDVLALEDVAGRRWIDTRLGKRIVIAEENAAAALEVMGRFAIAPQWLIYLPPTMSPVETSPREGWLERPEEAFRFYQERGVTQVVLQEKHMGSRALVALAQSPAAAARRFGTRDGEAGAVWTRTGRPFFADPSLTRAVLEALAAAAAASDLWQALGTDWVLLDAELMPWSAKAQAMIEDQYAPVASAGLAGLAAAEAALARAASRGVPVDPAPVAARRARVAAYAKTWAPYRWPVASAADLRIAPFHLLASEGVVHSDKDHLWHMGWAERLAAAAGPIVQATRWRPLNLSDDAAVADAIGWWETLTASGGEGMVVKPPGVIARGQKGLIQPALKVRGREYLRLIYGPEYDAPEHLVRLKERGLGAKRAAALKEFALGLEALERFVAREPLRRVHECVFGILALESEPIDPRL